MKGSLPCTPEVSSNTNKITFKSLVLFCRAAQLIAGLCNAGKTNELHLHLGITWKKKQAT